MFLLVEVGFLLLVFGGIALLAWYKGRQPDKKDQDK